MVVTAGAPVRPASGPVVCLSFIVAARAAAAAMPAMAEEVHRDE